MEEPKMKNTLVEVDENGPINFHEFDDLIGSFEEVTSPASSSSPSSSADQLASDPLSNMSSLFQQLPIKYEASFLYLSNLSLVMRGLSMYYQGKARSFTSLANVSSSEDLAKAENPYNKKLKSCRSYGEGICETHTKKCSPNAIPRHVSKWGLHSRKGSCFSLSAKRGSDNLMGSRPPIPHNRSTSTTTIHNHTTLLV
ncbi:hypothetical protein RIF29_17303 [Crotalaria pallida]|uniref:Uncharacterized protein n=1 Tax=Crotalaria pallida TaxID=3830 RepID=A0AAN9FQC0_CROPI